MVIDYSRFDAIDTTTSSDDDDNNSNNNNDDDDDEVDSTSYLSYCCYHA